jgi:DNA repair exonuclease SbcCD ATPase subunit
MEERLPALIPELAVTKLEDDATEKTIQLIRFYRGALVALFTYASSDPLGFAKKFQALEDKRQQQKKEFTRRLKEQERQCEQKIRAINDEAEKRIAEMTASLRAQNARLTREANNANETARAAETLAKEMEAAADASLGADSGYFATVAHVAEKREELVEELVGVTDNLGRVVEVETNGYETMTAHARAIMAKKNQVEPMPPLEEPEVSVPASPKSPSSAKSPKAKRKR